MDSSDWKKLAILVGVYICGVISGWTNPIHFLGN